MLNKSNTLQLKALVLAICLATTATSVYADKKSKHSDHNHHGGSYSSDRGTKLRAYLNGVDEYQANGKIKFETKSSKTEFEAEVKIPVPSAALEISDASDANYATMNLVLSDRNGQAYAMCDLDFHKIKTDKYSGRTIAEFKVEISDRNGYLQEKEGICDVDLNASGIQSGVPAPKAGDWAEITIDTNEAVVVNGGF